MHHVFAHAVADRPLYRDDADRDHYLALLAWVIEMYEWHCLAYCLMNNHVHLVIETPHANLGKGMQRLHGDYARDLNQRHHTRGHVFDSRYGSVRAEDDAQLWTAVAYVVRNPVKAQLCATPEQWPWGGHRSIATGAPSTLIALDRLLFYFAAAGGDPLERYLAHVAGGAPAQNSNGAPAPGGAGAPVQDTAVPAVSGLVTTVR